MNTVGRKFFPPDDYYLSPSSSYPWQVARQQSLLPFYWIS